MWVRSLWVLIDVDGCCFELRGRLEEYTGTDVELWCVFDNEKRREEKRREEKRMASMKSREAERRSDENRSDYN